MKYRKPASKKLMLLPLILGISSFFTFALYYYSANHAPYAYTDIIIVGPILSFIGVIISIVTRKSRKLYPTLWTSGLDVFRENNGQTYFDMGCMYGCGDILFRIMAAQIISFVFVLMVYYYKNRKGN